MNHNYIEFYVNKFFSISNKENIVIDFIPSMLRRRLSTLDKAVISSIYSVYSEDVQNIVYSSKSGEVERLIKIIEQYNSVNEVSPNTFSGSVHNAPVGFYLFNFKKSIPYNAISASDNSIFQGLLSAVISNYDNILFCYSDFFNDKLSTLSLNISKCKKINSSKYKMQIHEYRDKHDNFAEIINFFSGKITAIDTSFYFIERCKND